MRMLMNQKVRPPNPQRAEILGSEAFMEKVLDHVDRQAPSPGIVRKDRLALSLEAIAQRHPRDPAIQEPYLTGAYTITEVAEFFGMHQSTASRIARR